MASGDRCRPLAALAAAALLGGCAAGPDFQVPAPPTAPAYSATGTPPATASSPVHLGNAQAFAASDALAERWWRALGSPRLDALIESARTANPTVAAAQAVLAQARERHAAQAGATLYPQVDAAASGQRQRSAAAGAGQQGPAREFGLWGASINVRYEFDFAGGNRRALEALEAKALSREFELQGAHLALEGNVATTAIALARLSAQIESTAAMVAAQQEQLRLTRERQRLGHASEGEVLAVQAQLERLRAQLPQLRKHREQNRNLLATLSGIEPGRGGMPDFTLEEFTLPGTVPLVLPSQLVRRRPDIRAAEALLKSANAEYGVAVANLYPQVNVSASAGSQALTSAALFGPGTAVWSLLAQVSQPLLRPGLPAEKRAAAAAFEAAAANYQSVVLESLRSVADVLQAMEQDALKLRAQAAAAAVAEASLAQARQRYALGAASYLEVLDAAREAHQARIDLAAAQSERLSDTVALFVATGGTAAR